MNSELHQNRTDFYTHGLLAVALLLGALILLRVAGFVTASSQARAMAARVDPNGPGVGDVDELLAPARTCAEELKRKNLFVVTPPRQNPVREVLGILGDEVLINDRWYKVGDSVEDAKIVAIDPTKVRIVWEGQEQEFSPIASSGGGGQSERSGPSRPGARPRPAGGPQMVVTGSRGGSPGQAGGGLSREEREKMREQFRNMSPEERQRAREQMRQRIEAGRR